MNKKELDKILEEHKLWLINYTKGKRADLHNANLVGKEYEIDNFNLMYNVECESGIHFFKTKKEAKKYKH